MTQGTVYKSVFKNTAYIFFIKLFPAFASVIVLILYSRNLSPEDYGNYQDFWVKLLLLGTIAYAGLPVTIITYSPDVIQYFAKQIRKKHVLLFSFWFVIWTALFAAFQTKLQLPILLSAGLLLMYVVHSIQEALLMVSRRMKGLLTVNFIYAIYFLLIHFLLLKNYDLILLLWLLLTGMLVRSVLLFLLIIPAYNQLDETPLQINLPGNLKNLWLHLGLYDLLQTIFRYIDKFLLASFLSASLFAIYFNGSQPAEIPFLPYLLGAVANAVLIQLSDKHLDQSQSYRLLYVSGKLLSCIVFPLFFFLWFFADNIFTVVFTEKYVASVPIFMTAILVLPLRAYNYTTLLQHLHKGAIINKGAILDLLLALTLLYPFYYLLGLQGVAFAFVMSTYIQVGYYLWHVSRLINVSVMQLLPLKNWMIKFAGFGTFMFCLHYLLAENFEQKWMLATGFVTTVFVISISLIFQLKVLKKEI